MNKVIKVYKDPKSITEIVKKEISGILNGGLELLKKSNEAQITGEKAGNYIISVSDVSYTGQSIDVNARLKDHLMKRTTVYTKFKNKLGKDPEAIGFETRQLAVSIGRKELEEFTIVNLPTELNISKKKAYEKFSGAPDVAMWQNIQKSKEKLLEKMKQEIDSIPFIPWHKAANTIEDFKDIGGIYIIKNHKGRILYVGESSKLHERYERHSNTTRFSIFRRYVATKELNLELKTRKDLGIKIRTGINKGKDSNDKKAWYLSDCDNKKVDEYTADCQIKLIAVPFGRFELEEYLIKSYKEKGNDLFNEGKN